MKQDQLKKLVENIGEFPTLPAVVARVIHELNNPYSSASNLTELISVDQAMTFRILKMANSAYYGFPRAISTVTESIVLLGFSTVRNLMLTTMMYQFNELTLSKIRQPGQGSLHFDQQEQWKHAVATAIAARELLLLRHQESSEQLGYLAGLMHDIGKIFFYQYMPEEYAQVLAMPSRGDEAFFQQEAKIMGADHGQAGAWIVDRWNLPQEIVEPIAHHHFPEQAGEQKELTLTLHYADQVAHMARKSEPEQAAWLAQHPDGLRELNFGSEQTSALWRMIAQEIKQIETFMSV